MISVQNLNQHSLLSSEMDQLTHLEYIWDVISQSIKCAQPTDIIISAIESISRIDMYIN